MYNFVKLKDHALHRFFNRYFLREREQLLKLIKRKPEKKKRRLSDESLDSRWENDIQIEV
jgi:isopentenyldiphosphate isomerase